jgi:hypothetical protein
VARDLAPVPDPDAFLDFDEGPYFDIIADFTPIEIGERVNLYALS